jgi:hypothetical protein
MIKRLTGWQRLGIVLSVLWFVVAYGGYAVYVTRNGISDAKALFDTCWNRSADVDLPRCQPEYQRDVEFLTHVNPSTQWDIAIGPIPVFWVLGWLALASVRWVRRGFQTRETPRF